MKQQKVGQFMGTPDGLSDDSFCRLGSVYESLEGNLGKCLGEEEKKMGSNFFK